MLSLGAKGVISVLANLAPRAVRALCDAYFAGDVRESLRPDLYFTIPYEAPENKYTFDGETEEEAAERIAKHYLISVGVPHQFEGKVDWFANPTYNG